MQTATPPAAAMSLSRSASSSSSSSVQTPPQHKLKRKPVSSSSVQTPPQHELKRKPLSSDSIQTPQHELKHKPSRLPLEPIPESTLPIQIAEENVDEVRAYIDSHLSAADIVPPDEREAIAAKLLDKAGGVLLWAELASPLVTDAAREGVEGEVILSMLDDMAPGQGRGSLDSLYAWKLRRLSETEKAHLLIVMQWVILAPEPLRLNELLVALRLTLLACRPGEGEGVWDTGKVLVVEPALSLTDLRRPSLDELGVGTAMDSPAVFWKWLRQISQGLLKLKSGDGSNGAVEEGSISSEPLGLQRVRPLHNSVVHFFLQGKGFQSLLPPRSDPKATLPPTDRFIDNTYYALLHVVVTYLNISELDALSRERTPQHPSPGAALPPEETSKWRAHSAAQRSLVMASYPFLRYTVDNLVFHLLAPRRFRYFLPQHDILGLFTAARCRVWRRWTHFLGFGIADADPSILLADLAADSEKCGAAATRKFLDPVYGARYRLERVLRRVWKTAREQQQQSGGYVRSGENSQAMTPTLPWRPGIGMGVGEPAKAPSDVRERSTAFMLVGGDDPLKAQWLVPTTTAAGPAVWTGAPTWPSTPRSPYGNWGGPPRALAGIQEVLSGGWT